MGNNKLHDKLELEADNPVQRRETINTKEGNNLHDKLQTR